MPVLKPAIKTDEVSKVTWQQCALSDYSTCDKWGCTNWQMWKA